jgi:hypothetical protein
MTASYSAVGKSACISQAFLRDYVDLRRREQEARAARTAQRDQIINMLASGFTIEPGPLAAEIAPTQQKSLRVTEADRRPAQILPD